MQSKRLFQRNNTNKSKMADEKHNPGNWQINPINQNGQSAGQIYNSKIQNIKNPTNIAKVDTMTMAIAKEMSR